MQVILRKPPGELQELQKSAIKNGPQICGIFQGATRHAVRLAVRYYWPLIVWPKTKPKAVRDILKEIKPTANPLTWLFVSLAVRAAIEWLIKEWQQNATARKKILKIRRPND